MNPRAEKEKIRERGGIEGEGTRRLGMCVGRGGKEREPKTAEFVHELAFTPDRPSIAGNLFPTGADRTGMELSIGKARARRNRELSQNCPSFRKRSHHLAL